MCAANKMSEQMGKPWLTTGVPLKPHGVYFLSVCVSEEGNPRPAFGPNED